MRCCALMVTSTSCASRSTLRCLETPGCVSRGNWAAMFPAVREPNASRSRIARLVGSAMAEKTLVAVIEVPGGCPRASALLRGRGARLEQCEVIAVRVREVRREAVVGLHGFRVLELQTAPLEDLEVFAEIVRFEHPVVAAATCFGWRS